MFSVAILLAALFGLSYEMIEDNFVNLICARIFGWRTLLLASVVAAIVVVPLSVGIVLATPVLLRSYLPIIEKLAGLTLLGVGIGWLAFAIFHRDEEPEEVRDAREQERRQRRSLALATQLMVVEYAEVVAILIPLAVAGHSAEAVVAGGVAIVVALLVALTLRRPFAELVRGRFRLLKAVSGTALLLLGVVLILT